MVENTVADSGLARSPSISGGESQEHLSVRESDDDADVMGSILAAAIGLTSLGAPASPARPPKENVVAPPKSAVVPQQTESARKDPKTTTAPDRRKPTTAVMAAALMTRPAPPPAYHDQLPMFTLQKYGSATGALLLPSRGIKMTQSQHPPPSHFATTVVHRPTPHPHLFPEYPNLPHPPSFTSQLRSNIHPDNLSLPPKRQKVNQRSRSTPLEQLPAHQSQEPTQQTHYPTQPATNGTAAVEPSPVSLSLNFPETLYEILSSRSNQHILSWLPHGHGFVIHDRQLFASQILPQHFDGAKFTSFTRRLKRWKFERVPRGPEMGAYYNKYFVRDRPDLVQGMMYGMEDDEQLMKGDGEQGVTQGPQTAGENDKKNNKTKEEKKKNTQDRQSGVESLDTDADHDDDVVVAAMEIHRQQQRQLKRVMGEEMVMDNTEGEGGQSENKKKREKKEKKKHEKNKSDTVTSFRVAYDDAVVEAAMKVHRQQQLQLQLQWQQQQLLEESQNSYQGKNLNSSYQETEAAMEVHRQQHLSKKSENSYQEKNLNKSYQETAWRQQQQKKQALASSRQDSSIPEKLPTPFNPSDCNLPGMSNMTWLNDTQFHRHHQSKLLQPQSSMESSGPKQPQHQKPHIGIWHTSQPGYQEPTKPQQKWKQQKQRMQPQHQKPFSSLNNPEELQMNSLPTPYNPEAYNSEDCLSMSMPHRNILATSSLSDNMSMPRRNNSLPGTRTSNHMNEFLMSMGTRRNNSIPGTKSSLAMNAFLSRHLSTISPPDIEQQQCLNDIERQILLEMSHPMPRTMSSSCPLSTSSYLERNPGDNHRMNYHSDRMNDAMSDQDSMLDNKFMERHLPMNNHRFLANQEMTQKILASTNTHKEIMMVAARDLQSRAGGGRLATASQQQQQLQQQQQSQQQPMQQHQHLLPPLYQSMQAPLSLSRIQQQLPLPLPSRTRYLESHAKLSQEHFSMQQQQQVLLPPPRHSSMQASLSLSTMQPPPSRTGYLTSHEMMLQELEEEVAKETLAAEAASTVAAAGLWEEREYGPVSPAKRRNSSASAA